MAALGKGISRSAGDGWRRCAMVAAAVVVAVAALSPLTGSASAQQVISDPLFGAQWNLTQIHAPAAWARSTGVGVRVGIVDTGVMANHEDLAGKVLASTNCISANGDPNLCAGSGQDDNGHGTLIAGIVAAARNGRGIVGVAPDASLIVAKVLNQDAGGTIVDVEAGIRWVVRHGAQVVNLSVGDNPNANTSLTELSFQAAVEEAWNAGAIPVVASGNPNALGPARESFARVHALVVGATTPSDSVATYSNALTTAVWGLVAPGGAGTSDNSAVVSDYWLKSNPRSTSSYAFRSGASMAAAHVSGVAALLLAEGLNRDQVVQRILDTASPVGCGGACHGRLDAAAAVDIPVPAPRPPARSRIPPATTPSPARPAAPPTSATAPPPSTTAAPAPSATVAEESDAARARDLTVANTGRGWPGNDAGRWMALLTLLALGFVSFVFIDIRVRRRRTHPLAVATARVSRLRRVVTDRDRALDRMVRIHLGLTQPPAGYDFGAPPQDATSAGVSAAAGDGDGLENAMASSSRPLRVSAR